MTFADPRRTGGGAWLDILRQRFPGQFPAPGAPPANPFGQPLAQPPGAPPTWQPSYFGDVGRTPYPVNPWAANAGATTGGRAAGGGGARGGLGGVGLNMPAIAVEPSTSLGPGAYWPGHSQEFQAQQQNEMMLVLAGLKQPDARQPAQVAASLARGNRPFGLRTTGAGSSGGGGGRLAGGYQDAYNQAEQANEARYGDILSGYQARRNANFGAGAQEAKDINKAWDAEIARRRQETIGRGLGNSNVLQNAVTGANELRSDNLGRLNEKLRREDSGLLADQLQFMERRTDEGPDMNQAIALAQGLGAAGVGQPRVVGTQVVPTMGGVGRTGYSMPVFAQGGGMAPQAQQGGPNPQQVRAAHVLANQGHAGAQAWLRQLQKRLG
jgi:hypothetical protein